MNKPTQRYLLAVNNGEGYTITLFDTIEEALLTDKYSSDWYICETINDISVYGRFNAPPKPKAE